MIRTVLAALTIGAGAALVPSVASSTPPLLTTIDSPSFGYTFTPTTRGSMSVSGSASGGSQSVTFSLHNLQTGVWLQPDGTFSPAPATVTEPVTHGTWSATFVPPAGAYTAVAASFLDGSLDPIPAAVLFSVNARDPLKWPYPTNSIWNTPIGDGATRVPLNMQPPSGGPRPKTLNVEDDLLFLTPDLPTDQWSPIHQDTAGWSGADRCASPGRSGTAKYVGSNATFPASFFSTANFWGRTPNHPAAIVMPDRTLVETQSFHWCTDADGTFAVSQYAPVPWQADSILTGGQGPDTSATPMSGGGAHGGSFMSALGGTIRLGEWVPGGAIPHAVKIEFDTRRWFTATSTAFPQGRRWPALRADSDHASTTTGYGSIASPGTRPDGAVMGALLTLPAGFQIPADAANGPAVALVTAIKKYGAYVVDSTKQDTVQFATEWSDTGRVTDEFSKAWNFPIAGSLDAPGNSADQNAFLRVMNSVYKNLQIVDDNRSGNVGGSGTHAVLDMAPPL